MCERMRQSSFLALALFLLMSSTVRCGDWPGWRGPSGQGISDEKDLPLTWNDKTGENMLWKVRLPGQDAGNRQDQNQSSPIVVKGRVLLTASWWPAGVEPAKNHPEHHVVCLDAANGKQLWETRIGPGPWQLTDLRGGYTAPTPASDGERVYVVFGSSVIVALDFDGKLLWRKEIIPFDFDVAIGSSPLVVGDTVILQCDGVKKSSRFVALDRKTGALKWEQKRPENDFSHSTPVLVRMRDTEQLLVAASNALQGVDPGSGRVLWWCAAKGDTVSPVFANGLVYCDSGRGGPGVAVAGNGSGDVTKTHRKWSVNNVPEGFSSPVVVGEWLYRLHNPGILRCRQFATGELVFTERLEGVSTSSSPFTTADGRIYLVSAGKSYVVKAGPKLEVLAINDLGDGGPSSPAVAEGRIYLKGRQHLYCIGRK